MGGWRGEGGVVILVVKVVWMLWVLLLMLWLLWCDVLTLRMSCGKVGMVLKWELDFSCTAVKLFWL